MALKKKSNKKEELSLAAGDVEARVEEEDSKLGALVLTGVTHLEAPELTLRCQCSEQHSRNVDRAQKTQSGSAHSAVFSRAQRSTVNHESQAKKGPP